MSGDALTWAGGLAGVAAAALVKGAIGFGFPLIATPLLALATDVRTAVAALIVPNIVMDSIQVVRTPGLAAALRRHASLILAGVVGTVIGTRLLAAFSGPGLLLILGATVLGFVSLTALRPAWRLPAAVERPLAPLAGLVAGTLGGLTNTPGVVLTPYLYAIGLPKAEFVRTISGAFLVLKLAQLGAVWHVGLLDRAVLVLSLVASVVSLGGFRLGLRVQDRVPQATFNRVVLIMLTVVAVAMLARGLRS
jgi:uncharacterized membrane protein YfcA